MGREFPVICTVTIPANQEEKSFLNVEFLGPDVRKNPSDKLTVPKGVKWIIKDVYVEEAPSIDGIVQFYVNDYGPIQTTQPLSTMLWSNQGRKKIKPITLKEFDTLSAYYINLAKGGTADTIVTFYMVVEELESGGAGGGVLDNLRAIIG